MLCPCLGPPLAVVESLDPLQELGCGSNPEVGSIEAAYDCNHMCYVCKLGNSPPHEQNHQGTSEHLAGEQGNNDEIDKLEQVEMYLY